MKWMIYIVMAAVLFSGCGSVFASADEPVKHITGKVRPKLIKKVDPVYPPEALEKKLGGLVVIEATLNSSGKVVEAKIIEGSQPLLNNAALDAVKQWEYKPYKENGKALSVSFTVTVTFSLAEKK